MCVQLSWINGLRNVSETPWWANVYHSRWPIDERSTSMLHAVLQSLAPNMPIQVKIYESKLVDMKLTFISTVTWIPSNVDV